MSLIYSAYKAGLMHRVFEIFDDISRIPTQQIRSGELWLQERRRDLLWA